MSRSRAAALTAALTAALLAAGCSGTGSPGAAGSGSGAPSHGSSSGGSTSAGPGSASPSAGWSVAAENRKHGTRHWRITRIASPAELSGYADHVEVDSGQPLRLYVSTSAATWTVAAYRVGYYGGTGGRLVWSSRPQHGVSQPAAHIAAATRTVTAPWRPSLTVATAGWPPGDYLLKLTAASGGQHYVPLVVRSPDVAGRVVLMNAPLTWQAYNAWGGYSLYHGSHGFADRAYAVSFDRPYDENGADKFLVYEQPVVVEAERLGLDLAYRTDIDVSAGGLAGARAVISLGHDEYWTHAERLRVAQARDAGTNLAFLGANEAYWQVRLAATPLGPNRLEVEYKSATLDPEHTTSPEQETARFRDLPQPLPENALSGLAYECFPTEASYVVEDPSFFGFAGTGVHRGSAVPGLVGVEIDRAYPVPATPRPLDVVAHSPVRCRGVATYSDSAYYTAASGAGVFAVGTMHWTCVLAGGCRSFGATDASTTFVRRVIDNVLRAFAAGPAGRRYPATDTLHRLGESPVNTTGAA